jgi:hypothetical protein
MPCFLLLVGYLTTLSVSRRIVSDGRMIGELEGIQKEACMALLRY